jgi:hypothetical protein
VIRAAEAQAALLVALVAGLVPAAAALVAICYRRADHPRAGLAESFRVASRLFPAMLVLLVIAGVLLAFLGGAGVMAAELVSGWCQAAWGEALAQEVAAVAVLPVLVAASVVGVVQDLARAAMVRFDVRAWRGLAYGVATFLRAPVALWWSWAWRGLASIAPVAAVGLVVLHGKTWPALVLLGLHQIVVFARVAIRASWWSVTLRAMELHPAAAFTRG